MPNCYSCDGDVSESHAFCPHCGVDDPNLTDPVCPSCDQDIESGWVRCPHCGEGLQTEQDGFADQIAQPTPVVGGMVTPDMTPSVGMGVPGVVAPMGVATPSMVAPMGAGMPGVAMPMGGSYGRPLSAMPFMGALKTCFKDKYFDFSGRASRSEFWWCYLGIGLLQMGIGVLWFISMLIAMSVQMEPDIFFMCSLCGMMPIYIGVTIPYLAASVRRLHDVGYSGWWMLIGFVPFGGIILLVWFCTDGEPHHNLYGAVPTNIRVTPTTGLIYRNF